VPHTTTHACATELSVGSALEDAENREQRSLS
jgi:hypothetical protein